MLDRKRARKYRFELKWNPAEKRGNYKPTFPESQFSSFRDRYAWARSDYRFGWFNLRCSWLNLEGQKHFPCVSSDTYGALFQNNLKSAGRQDRKGIQSPWYLAGKFFGRPCQTQRVHEDLQRLERPNNWVNARFLERLERKAPMAGQTFLRQLPWEHHHPHRSHLWTKILARWVASITICWGVRPL